MFQGRGRLAQHRHGAWQHRERRGAGFLGDRDHPVLVGLRRMLTQAIGERLACQWAASSPGSSTPVLSRTGREGDLR